MIGNFPVVLDTCVLVPMALADLLLRLAEEPRLYLPRWSPDILAELTRTLQHRLNLSREQISHRVSEMQRYFPEALVDGYQPLIASMTNHPKDRHVVAAAIRTQAQLIVTLNRKDFPAESLSPWGIEAVGPATFLISLFDLDPRIVWQRLEQQAIDTQRSPAALLEALRRDVPSFVDYVTREVTGPA